VKLIAVRRYTLLWLLKRGVVRILMQTITNYKNISSPIEKDVVVNDIRFTEKYKWSNNDDSIAVAEVTIGKKKYNIICMYRTINPTTNTMEDCYPKLEEVLSQ
jgi:hypothetical protein